MSTHDVPGYKPAHRDVLAMGAWAEHSDGSLIFVNSVEAGVVVFSVFDVAQDPHVEYRDAMSEKGFKARFSWRPDDDDADNLQWTWHDKTAFDWSRVMQHFPSGTKYASAVDQLTAAQRVARSLNLRAGAVQERHEMHPTEQRAARTIMERLREARAALRA